MQTFFENHGVLDINYFRLIPLKNFHFPRHFHRTFELIYVNNGKLSVSIDDKEYLLQKNDLAFIFPHQMHEFKTLDFSDITVILFSPELISDVHMNYKGFIPTDSVLHLEEEFDFTKLTSIYRQKSFLYAVCGDLISKKTFAEVKQSPKTKVLYKILLFIEQHYGSECNLKSVAKHLQYDYPYVSKLFVRMMNMTFTDYLNHYRILQACYILINSQQSIGEVATQCGYSNLRSFHRNFRKFINQSPKKYRAVD